MSTSSHEKSKSLTSARRLGVAGAAAVLGCALCCAIPLFVTAGLGGGAATALASMIRPGSELVVGGAVFVATLLGLALRDRRRRASSGGACAATCQADGSCRDRGTARTAT